MCVAFNTGECESHNGMLHMCSHCLEETGKHHNHPKSSCYSLMGNPQKKRSTARLNTANIARIDLKHDMNVENWEKYRDTIVVSP